MIEVLTYINAISTAAQRALRGKKLTKFILNRIEGDKVWINDEWSAAEDIFRKISACHEDYMRTYLDALSFLPTHNGIGWQVGDKEISNSECNLYIELSQKKLVLLRKSNVAARSGVKSFCEYILPNDGLSYQFRIFVFHCLNYFARFTPPDAKEQTFLHSSYIFNHEGSINTPSYKVLEEVRSVKTAQEFYDIIENERDELNRFWKNVLQSYMRMKHTKPPRLQA